MEAPPTDSGPGLGYARGRTEAQPRTARVQQIDFRRPTKFPRELIRRLEHAHDAFCRTASSGLSAELRTGFELFVAGSEQLPYGTAMAEASQDALLAVLSLEPLDTEAALIIELPLALRLVDRLLGGTGKARELTARGLTDLEVAVVRRAVGSLVEPLSATWQDLAGVSFKIGTMQSSPMTFQLVPPSEPVLIMVLEARLDGLVSPLGLYIPYSSVEPIVDRLEHRHYDGADHHDPEATGRVQAAVAGVDLELRAEVGRIGMPLARLLELRVGDVIRLRRPVSKGVVLHAGEVPTHIASAGRNGNVRAVQIESAWEDRG